MALQSNEDARDLIPAHFVERYSIVPLELSDGVLRVVHLADTPAEALRDLELLLGVKIVGSAVEAREIQDLIRAGYGLGAPAIESLTRGTNGSSEGAPRVAEAFTQDIKESADDSAIVSFVNNLVMQAYRDGATDIHIEPFENRLRVRERIDGLLHEVSVPAGVHQFHNAIVSRLKVMAHLDIAERRLPQDGRIRARIGSQDIDFRVSILPSPHGESTDLRILANASILRGLESLGLEATDLAIVRGFLQKPHGVVLVTGPTGSGKTTTLYSFLSVLNESHRKIITIEDPIEYNLDGITQVQVHPRIGLTFARGLRSMLRHDPDIMMVGEIRDQETAETVIRVALTGHLVFSTVHTNDAPSTPARLMDMGIEPYLVGSSVECFIAQRLLRLVCQSCAAPEPAMFTPKALGVSPDGYDQVTADGNPTFLRGRGCKECRFTGYRGRSAVFEFLRVTQEVREAILARKSASDIAAAARQQAYWPLRWKGLLMAARGRTTVEEVLRISVADAGA